MSKFPQTAILAAAGLLALGVVGARADITMVTWGGAYTVSQQKAYGESWEKKTGKKIHWVEYNGGLDEIRAQVDSGYVLWDVVDVFAHEARKGCADGLFAELPRDVFTPAPDGTPMDQEIVVPLPNNCVVPNIIWSWFIFYDETRFPGQKPRTLADFFDPDKFPGKRGMGAFPQANLEMALVADGVIPTRVYEVLGTPVGVDRAFAKLDSIRNQVVFWSSGVEPRELIKSGEAIMSTAYNGRVGAAILGGDTALKSIWDGQVLDVEWFVLVKGSPNYDEALDFLIHASAPRQQAAQAKWITYGPMRHSAMEIIAANEPWFNTGENAMPHMPNRAELMPRTIVTNSDWWANNGEAISERWKKWMGQ